MNRTKGTRVSNAFDANVLQHSAPSASGAISRATEFILISLVPTILIFILGTYHIASTYATMARGSERETRQIAVTVEQNVRRVVSEVDRTLVFLRESYATYNDENPWPTIFQKEFITNPMIVQVAATDRNGVMISSSSMLRPTTRIDLSDREHIRFHIEGQTDRLFISPPVQGRASGQWTIQFTRPYYDKARNFAGIVVVSLNVDYLARTYRDLDIDDQFGIALIGRDGIIRTGRGPYADQFGQRKPEAIMNAATSGVASERSPLATLLSGKPLTFTILRDLDPIPLRILFVNHNVDAHAHWLANTRFNLMATVGLSIGTLFLALAFVHRRLKYEGSLNELAFYDSLTGLANRRLFFQRLHARCDETANEAPVFLFLLDLDRLKQVNDRFGQAVGDAVLKQAAERLSNLFQDKRNAMVARLEGDEFAVFCDAAPDDSLNIVCQHVLSALRVPLYHDRHLLNANCSMGAVEMRVSPESKPTLLHAASLALQAAKQAGRNQFQIFDNCLNTKAERELELEAGLIQALQSHSLDVYYQPIVSARSRAIVGYEALVRWQLPDGKFVPPSEFVPIAEARGLVGDLGQFVIERVFSQAHRLIENPEMMISINVSARELHYGRVAEFLTQCALRHGVNPANIRIEITETAILDDQDIAVKQLEKIKALGYRILLDDFGTGYSSLSYLHMFPVAGLKIDRSFVRELHQDACNRVIVSAIVHIARELGLRVVAEGVEYEQEAQVLADIGVDYFQGYLFGKPAPIKLLESQSAA